MKIDLESYLCGSPQKCASLVCLFDLVAAEQVSTYATVPLDILRDATGTFHAGKFAEWTFSK